MRSGYLFLVLLAAACDDDTTIAPAPGPADAAVDAADAAMTLQDASPPAIAACAETPYTTSPSGAACDPKRVQRSLGLAGNCYGPALGAACEELVVTVDEADASKVAAGFVCKPPVNGKVTCAWSFDASSAMLDPSMLDAACATTIALPAAIVTCVVYGD